MNPELISTEWKKLDQERGRTEFVLNIAGNLYYGEYVETTPEGKPLLVRARYIHDVVLPSNDMTEQERHTSHAFVLENLKNLHPVHHMCDDCGYPCLTCSICRTNEAYKFVDDLYACESCWHPYFIVWDLLNEHGGGAIWLESKEDTLKATGLDVPEVGEDGAYHPGSNSEKHGPEGCPTCDFPF